jgi:hypothetical protein
MRFFSPMLALALSACQSLNPFWGNTTPTYSAIVAPLNAGDVVALSIENQGVVTTVQSWATCTKNPPLKWDNRPDFQLTGARR